MAFVPFDLKNLVFAKLLTDTEEGTTYGAVKYLAGAVDAKINPNASTSVYYAGGGAAGSATAKGAIEVELGIDALSKEVKAELLGMEIDANGVLLSSPDDRSPYVAIGFEAETDDDGKDLYWFYKGRFEAPSGEFQSKSDKVDFKTGAIKGTFIKRNSDNRDNAMVNSADAGIGADVAKNWFSAVYNPANPTP